MRPRCPLAFFVPLNAVPCAPASEFAAPAVLSGFDAPGSVQGKSGGRDNARAVPGDGPDSRPCLDEGGGCSDRAAGSIGAGCSQRVAVSADLCAKEHVDVFGHRHPPVAADVIDCYNCGRPVAAGRFAPHLHKCMGKVRFCVRLVPATSLL